VFVDLTHNKPKKLLKTKFYKQKNILKLWNWNILKLDGFFFQTYIKFGIKTWKNLQLSYTKQKKGCSTNLKSKVEPRETPRSKEVTVIEPTEASKSSKIRRIDNEQQN